MNVVTFNELRKHTRQKSKIITDKPVKLMIVDKVTCSSGKNIEKDPIAALYSLKTKTYPRKIVKYEIEVDRRYYNAYRKSDPRELKRTVAHELAHIVVKTKHNKKFKQTVRKLGSDDDKDKQKTDWGKYYD